MEKAYRNISIFFAGVLLVIFAGFFKTYFGLFPSFEKVTTIQHVHGLLFLLWFVMLLVQPILIRNRKYALHRAIGKFSYVLVPVIVVSIFFIARELYLHKLKAGDHAASVASTFVPFLQIVDFVWLYALAIYHKKHAPSHMRYMITTSLAISGAGIRRICTLLIGTTVPQAFIAGFLITDLVLLTLIAYDMKHKRNWRPYAVSLAIIGISQIAFYVVPQSVLWQELAGKFTQMFF